MFESTTVNARLSLHALSASERSVMRFVTFQLFAVIYLQKFHLGPNTLQINLPLVVFFFSSLVMLLSRSITLSTVRLGAYMVFVSFSIFSQIWAGINGSFTSVAELFLIYSFMTLSAPLSESSYHGVLNSYVKMMILPALIGIAQYGIQTVMGGGDPISMTPWVPKAYLIQGYFYDAHYPFWYSAFQRPNGFFFLEPSFFSFYLATAVIIEVAYFRRLWIAVLLIVATFLSTGSTGVLMLVLVSPFLLVKLPPKLVITGVLVAVVAIGTSLAMGIHLPLISRLGELNVADSGGSAINGIANGSVASGGGRIIVPFQLLLDHLGNPSFLFTGTGAGSTNANFGSAWPILKLAHEYGVVVMMTFIYLYVLTMFKTNYSLPLKLAVTVIYQFTGGYLLDSTMAEFLALLAMMEPMATRNVALASRSPIIPHKERMI